MEALVPYLFFDGNCKEALEFYKDCFGGEIANLQTFGEGPMDVPAEYKDKIMHAELTSGGVHFMVSDGMPGTSSTPGKHLSLSINFSDPELQKTVWKKLIVGGDVQLELKDQFWGGHIWAAYR